MKKLLGVISLLYLLTACHTNSRLLDISGEWGIRLDSLDIGHKEHWEGEKFETTIKLPGTTDDARLGTANTLVPQLVKPQLSHLTRMNRYVGAAWYSKEITIPTDWKEKDVILSLGRVLWDTQVWIDNKQVEGHEESLTTPHRYDLTTYLQPGKKQVITIRVDNRKRYDISNDMAHAYTDHTQIKWNGILGDIKLQAFDKVHLENVELYPDVSSKKVKAFITLKNATLETQYAELTMIVVSKDGSQKLKKTKKKVTIDTGNKEIEVVYDMGNEVRLWNEFNPNLYKATFHLDVNKMSSEISEDFGMRELKAEGNKLTMNGKPLFLRGTLECCIFPLTGTPPMEKKGWQKVFDAAKKYGLNHLRFHSWCPPEAAFEVADEMGFYLQIELPAWVLTIGKDKNAIRFLKEEADRIRKEYGNHPSFCLWSLGNELQGDFSVLSEMLNEIKVKDPRHLYTTTSFTFEKGHGAWPEKNDDFFITQWTSKGWVRGQGVFNQESPSFDKNYNASVEGMPVPLITHEIGQYSVYPDLSEIEKYTGMLKPLNFMAIKNDLEQKGLLEKAPDYLMASGKLASILYKEEIERALKTTGISGFQLLDLHDFPGQGTALVGLLNAFWESKGVISGAEFRDFCSPVVPLLNFSKAVYLNNEIFEGKIIVSNYGDKALQGEALLWEIIQNNEVMSQGKVKLANLKLGYNGDIANIKVPLNAIKEASRLEVRLRIEGTEYSNHWNIWVYPSNSSIEWGKVNYTRSIDEAEKMLAEGKMVLFNPDWKKMKGIEGKFVPVFWSPVHFPNQAGTMGILCNPAHKALALFPTEMHTDWQWWDLNIHSTTLITDSIVGGEPIVELIDNFANNRRLASLYEGKVGAGKLILATFDLNTDLDERPVAKQMLISLLHYMNSDDFAPNALKNFECLKKIIGTTENMKQSAKDIY